MFLDFFQALNKQIQAVGGTFKIFLSENWKQQTFPPWDKSMPISSDDGVPRKKKQQRGFNHHTSLWASWYYPTEV